MIRAINSKFITINTKDVFKKEKANAIVAITGLEEFNKTNDEFKIFIIKNNRQ